MSNVQAPRPGVRRGTERSNINDRWRKAKKFAANKTRRFVLMFLYLWALFSLFALNEDIALRQKGSAFRSMALPSSMLSRWPK